MNKRALKLLSALSLLTLLPVGGPVLADPCGLCLGYSDTGLPLVSDSQTVSPDDEVPTFNLFDAS